MKSDCHTPAKDDKHFGNTLLFVAIVVVNHRLHLDLTVYELGLLATVLGVYMGVSQAVALTRFKTLNAPETPNGPPTPPAAPVP